MMACQETMGEWSIYHVPQDDKITYNILPFRLVKALNIHIAEMIGKEVCQRDGVKLVGVSPFISKIE